MSPKRLLKAEFWLDHLQAVGITAAAFGVATVCALVVWSNLPGPKPAPDAPDDPAGPRAVTDADVPRLCGWLGEEEAKQAYAENKARFVPFVISSRGEKPARATAKRVVLWDAMRKVNGGQHYPTYRQEVGDCVSMGASNAIAYLLAVQIALGGTNQRLEVPFQPWIYGTSRVQIGGGRIGGDGSVGAWAASALLKYGALSAKSPDCPPYSGAIARQWGRGQGPPQKFFPLALPNVVKSAAKVKTADEAIEALENGYPVTIASNQGFRMRGEARDGKLWGIPAGSWAHQMVLIGVDFEPEPCCYVLNSWGADAHGAPVDDAPPGGFWIKKATVQRIVAQDDSFAFSDVKGFPERDVNLDVLRLRQSRRVNPRRRLSKRRVRCEFPISVSA